jgi:dihydroorotate dehydrogenase
MGFPNPGYHQSILTLRRFGRPKKSYLGISLGKGKNTPVDLAIEEVLEGIRLLWEYADFFVINWSSPNTPGLRALILPERISELSRRLESESRTLKRFYKTPAPPVLFKLHPDLSEEEGEAILRAIARSFLHGIVAINTTSVRDQIPTASPLPEGGGISGPPLAPLRDLWIRKALEILPKEKIILACGGVSSREEIQGLLNRGVYGVEILTALIYQGPALFLDSPMIESPGGGCGQKNH